MTEPRETYKRFPRTLAEAFPQHYREQFDPLNQLPKDRTPPDYWMMLACAFALGFLVALLVVGT
jgi:hypothetical protein